MGAKTRRNARPHKGVAEKNGSQLPFRKVQVEQLGKLSDRQVTAVANGSHREFGGCIRRAIVDHARLAGAALNEMKRRVGHGGWEDWQRDNFAGSPETARLYMRIDDNWDRIVEHGLDRLPDLTLEDLRWFLSRPGPKTDEKETPPTLDVEDVEDGEAEDGEAEDEDTKEDVRAVPPRSEARQYAVVFRSEAQRAMFGQMARALKEAYPTATEPDAIYRAVETCYKEVCHG